MVAFFKKLWSHRPSFEISVGVVLFLEREGEPLFLLLRYPHGHWDFVKGHQDKGESFEETLRREVKEETGIANVEIVPSFQDEVRFYYTAKGTERVKRQKRGNGLYVWKRVVYFTAKTSETGVELSDEHVDWAWLSYNDAKQRITHENSKRILEASKGHIDKYLSSGI